MQRRVRYRRAPRHIVAFAGFGFRRPATSPGGVTTLR